MSPTLSSGPTEGILNPNFISPTFARRILWTQAFSIVCPLLLYFVYPLLLHTNDMFLKVRVMSHLSLYQSNCHAWNKCVLNNFFMTDKCSEF